MKSLNRPLLVLLRHGQGPPFSRCSQSFSTDVVACHSPDYISYVYTIAPVVTRPDVLSCQFLYLVVHVHMIHYESTALHVPDVTATYNKRGSPDPTHLTSHLVARRNHVMSGRGKHNASVRLGNT